MKSVGIGVIGLGFMGATHVAAYQTAEKAGFPCKLAAVCDIVPARRLGELGNVGGNVDGGRKIPRAFDPELVRGYERAEDLLADKSVDLVSVCTQTHLHVEIAEALLAGKHVIVEKPVAVEASDIHRLVEVARKTEKICMPAMCMRYWPHWAWLKARLTDGSLGKCNALWFTRMGASPNWSSSFFLDGKKSGGALVDLHIHDADFVYWLLGLPTEVSSAGCIGWSGAIDQVTTIYRYRGNNAPAHILAEGGWCTPGFGFRMRYIAHFEKATADFDIGRDAQLLLCRDGKAETVPVDNISGYDGEIRAIVNATSTGNRQGLPTVEEAEAVARLLDAERQSISTGQSVAIAPA